MVYMYVGITIIIECRCFMISSFWVNPAQSLNNPGFLYPDGLF